MPPALVEALPPIVLARWLQGSGAKWYGIGNRPAHGGSAGRAVGRIALMEMCQDARRARHPPRVRR